MRMLGQMRLLGQDFFEDEDVFANEDAFVNESRKALRANNMRGGGEVIPKEEEFDNAYLHGSEWGRIESLFGRRPWDR
jgi:hypothetical protein